MKKLCIAIYGNTNNYLLLLAQGLKANGHDVRLLINRKELLHRPEARYPDWASCYPEWIFDCSNVTDEDIAYQTPAIESAIYHLTHKVDLVILNDSGPALAGYLKSPHIVVLTGSDLAYYASYSSVQLRTGMWDPEYKRSLQGRRYQMKFADAVARQRDGILAARIVCYAQKGLIPTGDILLEEIGVEDRDRFMLHFSNTIDLQEQPAPKNRRLRILNGGRIVFQPNRNPTFSAEDFKGTDMLIHGFANYLQEGGQGILRLVKKGQDLEAAISLICSLGIEARIEWVDEMPLHRFYDEMIAADLICDQFGSSFPGMVTTDAYALGRPVMANLRNEVFLKRFPEPLPGLHASSANEVAKNLKTIEKNPDTLVTLGKQGRGFAEKYLTPRAVTNELLEKLPKNLFI